jgi:hypothetical protein
MADVRDSDPFEIRAWADSLTVEQVTAGIAAAIRDRDWLAVEGLVKLLALKDPEAAQAVYDTLSAAVAAGEGN